MTWNLHGSARPDLDPDRPGGRRGRRPTSSPCRRSAAARRWRLAARLGWHARVGVQAQRLLAAVVAGRGAGDHLARRRSTSVWRMRLSDGAITAQPPPSRGDRRHRAPWARRHAARVRHPPGDGRPAGPPGPGAATRRRGSPRRRSSPAVVAGDLNARDEIELMPHVLADRHRRPRRRRHQPGRRARAADRLRPGPGGGRGARPAHPRRRPAVGRAQRPPPDAGRVQPCATRRATEPSRSDPLPVAAQLPVGDRAVERLPLGGGHRQDVVVHVVAEALPRRLPTAPTGRSRRAGSTGCVRCRSAS